MSNFGKILRGAGIVFIGTVVSKIFNYFYRMFVASRLGPQDYGLLSLGFAFLGIASAVCVLGLPSGVTRYVSFFNGAGELSKVKGTILASIKIALPLSTVTAVIAFFLSDFIAEKFFHEPSLGNIIKLFSILVPFIVVGNNFDCAILGFQKIKYNVFSKLFFESGFQLALTIFLIYLGYGVFGAAIGYVVAMMAANILLLYFLKYKVFNFLDKTVKSEDTSKTLLKFALPLGLTILIGTFYIWTDSIVLGYFKSTYDVGIYNAALPIASLLIFLPQALTSLFMPIVTDMYSKNKINGINKIYKLAVRWILLLNFPIVLAILAFPKAILNILFGQTYVTASTALIILAFGFFIYYLFLPSQYILQMAEKTKLILINTVITTAINLALSIYLTSRFGILGAATATSLSMAVFGTLLFLETKTFRAAGFFDLRTILIMPIGAISLFAIYFIREFVASNNIFILAALGFLLIAIYGAMLFLFRFFRDEDKEIFGLIANKIRDSKLPFSSNAYSILKSVWNTYSNFPRV